MLRLIAYIDGFNLYYGLRSKGWRRYYWLDVHRLVENLLKPGQRLVTVHYFTARIRSRPGNQHTETRQRTFLEALATLPDVHLHYGHYLAKPRRCPQCHATWKTFEEKMTDVNIAVELLCDAHNDAFDAAIIVSGDSDLTRPVEPFQLRGRVAAGLIFNRRDLLAPILRLGLHNADGFLVDEENVVGGADIRLVFADGDAEAVTEVDLLLILN